MSSPEEDRPAGRVDRAYARLGTIKEEEILRIHVKAAAGLHRGTGVQDVRKLRRMVKNLRRAATERRDPVDIIAEIFDDIERDPQPFVDCNHRTAMHLGRFLAFEFGFDLKYTGPEGRRLRKQWESMDRKELEAWIRKHLVPLKGD